MPEVDDIKEKVEGTFKKLLTSEGDWRPMDFDLKFGRIDSEMGIEIETPFLKVGIWSA